MWFWKNTLLLLKGISFGKKPCPVYYQELDLTENMTFLQYLATDYCIVCKLVWFEI